MVLMEQELVERDHQLRVLEDLLICCGKGGGGAARVSGPVASGKTELVQCFVGHATDAGARVLTAVGSRAEQMLPLGVVGQLLPTRDLPQFAGLLTDGARMSWPDAGCVAVDLAVAPVLQGFCQVILELAEQRPLVIVVDDAQHADVPSLQCLCSVIRRLRNAPVLVLLVESDGLSTAHPLLHDELARAPRCLSIQLEPLSRHGVATFLSRYPDLPTADFYDLSGGNPLLLQALVEDCAAAQRPLAAGDAFARAVVSCLYRSESMSTAVARALAVLGEPEPASTLGRLLDLDADLVRRSVELLNRAGILNAGWFRHSRAREAVLVGMSPAERAAMHRQVATLLHSDGAPAAAVSRHLVLASRIDAPWVQPVLREAAEQALPDGDVGHALQCLRLAREACSDGRHRAETTLMLARVEWRLDPSGVLRHLPSLVDAVRDGHLDGPHATVAVSYLLWHGLVDEATQTLTVLCSAERIDSETAGALSISLLWMAYAFPERVDQVRQHWQMLSLHGVVPPDTPPQLAVSVLAAMMARSQHGDAVAAAEQLLQRIRPNDETLGPISVAIAALVFTERLCAAVCWCDLALGEETARKATTCQALSAYVRAELALREGDLAAAGEHVQQALSGLSPKGWGVAIGNVLSTAVLANTSAGRYEVAARQLRVPVPGSMFRTPFGLKYLHARGTYYLATKRVRAAVSDFQMCGDIMASWGIDMPALAPWRTDLAEAYIALGRPRQGMALAHEQLRRLTDEQTRVRGVTLRTLAAASEPALRPALLREAVDLLQAGGNRLEVAEALADLGDALHQNGESRHARTVFRTARKMVGEYPATALPLAVMDRARLADSSDGVTALSEAERRVAILAASGHTNREIASKLYVTVSTVEQHLTRVYRKLRVNRRADLRTQLNLGRVV
jgi:DNA-binding CsgD family transcriptional regulator